MRNSVYYVCILFFFNTAHSGQSAITFTSGGRLGDKLISYCKAKWLAYTYDLNFLCSDFPMKETLLLDQFDEAFTPDKAQGFKRVVYLKDESEIRVSGNDTLYISDFHIKPHGLENSTDILMTFNKHPEFLEHLRSIIAPHKKIIKFDLPEGALSVAVHIRRGGGFDQPLLHGTQAREGIVYADKKWPMRFPPDEYYIQQIQRLASLFSVDQPLYIHLFTDDKHPETMAKKYQKSLGLPNITFGYRADNDYKSTMLEDLFGMAQFDYLIRSTSSFSFMAMILGNHKLIFWPKHATWHDNCLTIDRVWMLERHSDGSIAKVQLEM